MNGAQMIGLAISILFLIILLVILVILAVKGIRLCKKNNAIGVIFLFLSLFILGLVIGVCLLYNAKNGAYEKKLEAAEDLEVGKEGSKFFKYKLNKRKK